MAEKTEWTKWRILRLFLAASVLGTAVAIGGLALLVNIFEHKQDQKTPFFQVVALDDTITDPAEWGKNFPMHYEAYQQTVDMVRTRHGGSEAMPRTPTDADPRSVVAQQKLEEDPRLVKMWAGYAFSEDFREERGHAYMLEDQLYTSRQQAAKQPGACINCHASTYTAMKELGAGDLRAGFEKINAMPYQEAVSHVTHPISCIDCHKPDTMELRVTRPAFIEGIAKVKAAQGIPNYDVNTMATRQEMRTYSCAQCHVEYYFKGTDKQLTFPWDKGLKADEILAYYDEIGFKDWTHKETGAAALKAQHPEFETWSQGIHARSGVSCADCHMPYQRVGAMKITNHHIQSPMLNINAACQVCHRIPEEELRNRVETIQGRHIEMRDMAMDSLMDLIDGIKSAKDSGASEDEMADALLAQRRAQFLLDFAEAENSTGFHADQEGARVLAKSLDHSRKGWMSISEVWRKKSGEE